MGRMIVDARIRFASSIWAFGHVRSALCRPEAYFLYAPGVLTLAVSAVIPKARSHETDLGYQEAPPHPVMLSVFPPNKKKAGAGRRRGFRNHFVPTLFYVG